MTKEECLARWRKNSEARTKVAQQIIAGKRKMNPEWERWKQFDIRAEIALLNTQREESKHEHKRNMVKHRQ